MGGNAVGTPRRARAKLPEEIKDSTLHLRLREGLKEDATSVLADIGISVPEAIRVFLGRIVSEGKFPFELEVPNAVTRRAMEQARRLDGGRFATARELFDDLENGGAQ